MKPVPREMGAVTVIVPTYNMARFLKPLYESIARSDFSPRVKEILFISDGSTDETRDVVRTLSSRAEDGKPAVRLIELAGNEGTFRARHRGALEASTEKLLFIDSRITLPSATTGALSELMESYPALVAHCDVDDSKNIYCLYWRRSHDRFYRPESMTQGMVTITAARYDEIPFGSTCFTCPREAFLRACQPYLNRKLWSDDTLLFGDLVREVPFVLHPLFRIDWQPRDRAWPFLKRLFDRGPGLAQYHFFKHRGKLFYAVVLATSYGGLALGVAFWRPLLSLNLLLTGLIVAALSTALLTRNAREFCRLAPLHVAVIVAYGLGALRGAWVVWRNARRESRAASLQMNGV